MSQAATSYDLVPYPRHSYVFTHPDRLATLATLHGMSPPPVDRCRVLELGCASGANLVPMAYELPGSDFLGIDLSRRQIAEGQQFIDALGLENIRLVADDLSTLDASIGPFDYIIAHGVHSWVPLPVQEAVMRLCGELLSPGGVALISYNAYPGCHLRQMVRGMGQFHVRDIDDPAEQVAQLHALVRFLADSLGDEYKVYRQVLRSEAERLAKLSDVFILHDVLEATNYPVYFHQFIAQAARHGLQYLDEALPLGPERLRIVAAMGDDFRQRFDPIEYEQHLDFLDGTAFRRTLICRDSIEREREIRPARLDGLLIASQARPVSPSLDVTGSRPEEFAARKGPLAPAVRCDSPIGKAALFELAEAYPRALPLAALGDAAANRIGRTATAADDAELRELILGGFAVGAVELHTWQPQVADVVGSHPVASPVARYEIAHGWEATTLWHERLTATDPISRDLISILDGKHDRNAIIDRLAAAVVADQLLPAAGQSNAANIRAEIAGQLESALGNLARAAVLIS